MVANLVNWLLYEIRFDKFTSHTTFWIELRRMQLQDQRNRV